MTRITKKDVWCLVDSLNKKYGFDDNTPCKFYLFEAYGGCLIAVKKKNSQVAIGVTYGYKTPRQTIDDFYKRKEFCGKNFLEERIKQCERY